MHLSGAFWPFLAKPNQGQQRPKSTLIFVTFGNSNVQVLWIAYLLQNLFPYPSTMYICVSDYQ